MGLLKVGQRIICDQDGEIITILSEMEGHVLPRKEITSLHSIDLEFGSADIRKFNITGVDMKTMQPILEQFPINETEEQKRIRELEDALLLQAETDLGGIL